MKQRITYLVPNPDDFKEDSLEVKDTTLSLRDVKAAKEHRITVGLSELPQELRKAFEQWHELHIRWASEIRYTTPPPFTSRVSPGLHVFFTPHETRPEGPLCPLLKKAFGHNLVCSDSKESFIKLPILSERFSMSSSSQFYAHTPTLSGLAEYIQNKICPTSSTSCRDATMTLLSASYLDIDYDAISHALIINAMWAKAPKTKSWTENISLPGKEETIEVGVLNQESNPDPEDLAFSGFLTVLGQDTKPKPTRFQAPVRHYPLPSSPNTLTYTTSFSRPIGLHPTLLLTLPTMSLEPPEKTCKLHTHLTLPSYLFIDKYQFTDPLFLFSKNLKSLRSIAGATDLEAPNWVIPQWGSAALFELAIPSASQREEASEGKGDQWEISIPLHLRYLPATNSSHARVPVPWPVLFWACRAEEGTKMSVNPFDRLHLGYEGLFGPKTRFMHVPPIENGNGSGRLVEWIDVPVLDLRKTAWVEWGTMGVVLVAFLGLSWVLFAGRKYVRKEEKKKQ